MDTEEPLYDDFVPGKGYAAPDEPVGDDQPEKIVEFVLRGGRTFRVRMSIVDLRYLLMTISDLKGFHEVVDIYGKTFFISNESLDCVIV